jgi:hypothetical protein
MDELRQRVMTEQGDWTVKGFIDVYQRIYTISVDTKVLSKVLELLMFPVIARFAAEQGYRLVLAQAQNHYPDMSLLALQDESQCFALDIKTTYRTQPDSNGQMRVNGMTLGTFGGYFRTRDRPLNSTFPYNRYQQHYVLGVIYSRVPGIDERQVYSLDGLHEIPSVATDFQFFLQEKYRIASDSPSSGNTRNIGSTHYEERLLNGSGVFTKLGVDVFDDYWMHFRTRAMASAEGFAQPPYSNLLEYQLYKRQGAGILDIPTSELETEAGENTPESDT